MDSDDMEIVRLGAEVLKQCVPKESWKTAMEALSFKQMSEEVFIKKWYWRIDNDDIIIFNTPIYSLW